jgi:hypothetical protein
LQKVSGDCVALKAGNREVLMRNLVDLMTLTPLAPTSVLVNSIAQVVPAAAA